MTDKPKTTDILSESGHWYDSTGKQIESVPRKTATKDAKVGDPREPSLRDARKHQWAPGCTTPLKQTAKPQLDDWKQTHCIQAAWELTQGPSEDDKTYMDRIKSRAKEVSGAAAEEGTRIHKAIELHRNGKALDIDPAYLAHVNAAKQELDMRCGADEDWWAERGVISEYGYGTKIDIVSDAWLIDTKSRGKTLPHQKPYDKKKLLTCGLYPEYKMQLAAGLAALNDGPRKCAVLLISRDIPGLAVLRMVSDEEIAVAWRQYLCQLLYWQLDKGYRPDWAKPIEIA